MSVATAKLADAYRRGYYDAKDEARKHVEELIAGAVADVERGVREFHELHGLAVAVGHAFDDLVPVFVPPEYDDEEES